MTTTFPLRAKRDDPNGHMIVQQMLEFLRDAYDTYIGKAKFGSATVTNGNTTVTVTHSLGAANYAALVTPTVDPAGRFWLSGKSSTAFTINLQVAAGVGGVTFDWEVRGA